jgi:hypothetical protein
MEEFIMAIEKNIKDKTESKKNLKNREILRIILEKDAPKLKIEKELSTGGDIKFTVARLDLGLDIDTFLEYKKQIFNPFTASAIGELLVRENIEQFVVFLTDIDADSYIGIVNSYKHNAFGIEVSGDDIVFSFHISLIQSILTEDVTSG